MLKSVALNLTARVEVGAGERSERVLGVAALFGIPLDQTAQFTLFEDVRFQIHPGDVVLITGPSGAGKSTLLRSIQSSLMSDTAMSLVELSEIPIPADRAVIDCFSNSLDQALAHLARSGLSEAHLCLRTPAHLSEGQRFRYRLAQFFASSADILIADEFAATLDRVTARVVSHQLHKFIAASRSGPQPRAAIVATTHEDLADDLRPTVRIWKGFHDQIQIERKGGDE